MLEKSNEWKLAQLFFRRPLYKYHFRELCRILNWSPSKLQNSIKTLISQNIIKKAIEKNLTLYFANTRDESYKKYKIIYNILKTMEISDYLEKKIEYFDAIILFGSAVSGDDTEKSDIDICIVGTKEKEVNLREFEEDMERKISLIFIKDIKILKSKNPELLNNLINGIVLKGYLEVI